MKLSFDPHIPLLPSCPQARREIAHRKLHSRVPEIGRLARTMVLEDTDFDVDRAVSLLRVFQARHGDSLEALHRRRVAFLRRRDGPGRNRKNPTEDGSRSPSTSDSDSDSDSSIDRRRRRDFGRDRDRGTRRRDHDRKHEKARRRDRDQDRGRDRDRDRDRDRSSRKRSRRDREEDDEDMRKSRRGDRGERREREERDPRGRRDRGGKEGEVGRFGLISKNDLERKYSDFVLWAREVKSVDVDGLPKRAEEELFVQYVEDYNTARFPHRKYYDTEKYRRKKAEKLARMHGVDLRVGDASTRVETGPGGGGVEDRDTSHPNTVRQSAKGDRIQKAYEALKAGKADEMRKREAMRVEAMNAFKTGNDRAGRQLMRKLDPSRR